MKGLLPIGPFTALSLACIVSGAWAAEPDLSKLPPPAKQNGVTYEKDIRPLFEASCFRCHGEQRPKAGLRLDDLEAVLKGGEHGKVIVAGQSDKSPLVLAVAQIDEKTAMPPKPRPGQFGGRQGGPPGPPPGTGAPSTGTNSPARNGATPAQGPGGGRGGFGPPPKPLTPEQVGLVRAWIDQGAK